MRRILKQPGLSHRQKGVMLLEALIGLMIFSIGILAMVGMQAAAFSAAADAKYRADAAAYATDIISKIWMSVDRSSDAATIASLNSFQYNITGADCAFSGGAVDGTNAKLTGWVNAVTSSTGLLGATAAMQQITVSAADRNRVTVTVCWQAPQDLASRKHQVITYVY
ncbi:MAG: type IV pilus modification protein PilV [Betaproteobacteria bacterium]|jgi:type IV pilus assembly protein PilV|nr:type IV pilus modification protein PilV [Betaproteobacteria bacterium]MDH4293581.1 type IV pilus modification protein PilV [Betaproteobacteria bacterium]MDH5343626.1 type IV pilus modification protein PilV [Betaproteobacteria bacterium]